MSDEQLVRIFDPSGTCGEAWACANRTTGRVFVSFSANGKSYDVTTSHFMSAKQARAIAAAIISAADFAEGKVSE